MIYPKILEMDSLSKRAESEMPSLQKHNSRNDDLPHAKRLDCRGSWEKLIHVETAESSSDHSCSEMVTEHFTDLLSANLTFSSLKNDCASGSKQPLRPKRRSSIKLNPSALCRQESQDDFLKAVLTPVKATRDQDSSYEDYFLSSDLDKSKVSLPSATLQKLQSPSRVVYKRHPSQSKQEAVLQKSSTKEKTVSGKRKKMAENNENIASSDCMQSVSPHSNESATLNCMIQVGKANAVEIPVCLLNHNIQQKMHITIANRCTSPAGKSQLKHRQLERSVDQESLAQTP